jgi:AcrR family transcriptional regulator
MAATRQATADTIEQRVVDAALALATEVGWEQVRLSTIADRIQLPLAEIGRHFRDVDAIANAWFARARLAMLALPAEELAGRPADERIAQALGAWLDSLAPYRRVAAEILRYKLYPSHLHHWVPLIFDLSRLVHDLLDVAWVPGSGRLRQIQEIGLTAITLVTLAEWLQDGSPGQERSKRCLQRRLTRAGRLARCIPATKRASPATPAGSAPAAEPPPAAPRPRRRAAPRTSPAAPARGSAR